MSAIPAIPTLLFGAFDRHNFGDLLFPHIAAALLSGQPLLFAGLAERDLRAFGGHQIGALVRLAVELGGKPVNILHVGGELLTCDAWQAALMLLPPEQAQEVIARLDTLPQERMAWARERLGLETWAPYCVARALFSRAAGIVYCGVGGVELAQRPAPLQAEVLAKLKAADAIGVRESQTQALLAAAGIAAHLMPDPAVLVAELFGERIHRHGQGGEVAALRQAFPRGYIAVQFSADFGDDATLAAIAAQLDRAAASGLGVVLFRAGAAPWHDDLAVYRRLAAHMCAEAKIFESLHLWDICALIALSRGYCGSSLHGRIVAMAFALPRLNLLHPAQEGRMGKQTAYVAAWEAPGLPTTVGVGQMAAGIAQALAADPEPLRQLATTLAARYRREFTALCTRLE